ncbi:MAG: DEAD/DEAH box helicase [Planctomycetes bacterium]|nr:DEAD/DEAH box helicase [Planctomycetota bacterium]
MSPSIVRRNHEAVSYPAAVLREREDWGIRVAELVSPPRRLWEGMVSAAPTVETDVDLRTATESPEPISLLRGDPAAADSWQSLTRRTLARLRAYFLVVEDPQRRLDARQVETLAHQVSLVRHVLGDHRLKRVLIGDEVGLGKTVETGLILKELLEAKPGLRVLYLAPAKLVRNVRREFDRLGLAFRQWTATDSDARLTDRQVLASMHKAVHSSNFDAFVAAPPWDIVVVDECHHLSAWAPGGGDPRQAYKLVRELLARQGPEGRTILLSGTPHQGNPQRFENLLHLLRGPDEPEDAVAGRVIYRTKDDVRDWNGAPLFPRRKVNEPVVIDLGKPHRQLIENIHEFYRPSADDLEPRQAERRAAGWRCVQALQWAASSSQAGLGFLVRQAIRAGWRVTEPSLAQALEILRPYRLGSPDEPIEQLFARIERDVREQADEQDLQDIEEGESSADDVDRARLGSLLRQAAELVRSSGDEKWEVLWERVLAHAGDEKVVLFAQPVETVTALARYLQSKTGKKPAIIIGGQSDAEREKIVASFWRDDGPQFLVSSRAGGEGLNLQIARRLVHVDVPWNPMDMEQRVGRVHRFGSRRTILVDTLVVKDSREADAYRIAREKLRRIASALVESDRFEGTFTRVMCLLPPEELQSILIEQPVAPLSDADQERLSKMVQEGFHSWKKFHDTYGKSDAIRAQDPGAAQWDDVIEFLQENLRATQADGFAALRFRLENDEVVPDDQPAVVIRLADGQAYACGDYGGMPVSDEKGRTVKPIGLNDGRVSEALRASALTDEPCGIAHVRWQAEHPIPSSLGELPAAVLAYVRRTVRADSQGGWIDLGSSLHLHVVHESGDVVDVGPAEKRALVRGLWRGSIRTKPELSAPLSFAIESQHDRLLEALRRPTQTEMDDKIRHAVMPLMIAVVTG